MKLLELYQKAKNTAYKVLLDGGITALPFDIVRLTICNGIKIFKNSNVNELRRGEAAVIRSNGSDWYIIYDDTIASREYKRYFLAHELGRKALNQPSLFGLPNDNLANATRPERPYSFMYIPQEEKEAEAFARHLLAPLFLLRDIGITDSCDIARVCQIPIEPAEQQAEILEYYIKAATPLNQLENQLYEQFRDYINQYKK